MDRDKALKALEEYRQPNGAYDLHKLYEDLIQPDPDEDPFGLEVTFAAYFGDGTPGDNRKADEPELVKWARMENERIADDREAVRVAEIAQIVAAPGKRSQADWRRLVELGAARLTGDADNLMYEMIPEPPDPPDRSWDDRIAEGGRRV